MRDRDLRSAGVTLLEVLIASAVSLSLLGGAAAVVLSSERAFTDQSRQLLIESSGRRAMNRLADELRQAEPATVLPLILEDSDFVMYQRVAGYSNGTQVLGPVITLAYEAGPPGETGFITFADGASAPVRIVGHVLAARFSRLPSGIAFEVDIGALDRDGQMQQRTFAQQVAYRNDASGGGP